MGCHLKKTSSNEWELTPNSFKLISKQTDKALIEKYIEELTW